MCRSEAEGGRRCKCSEPEARRPYQRAKRAANRIESARATSKTAVIDKEPSLLDIEEEVSSNYDSTSVFDPNISEETLMEIDAVRTEINKALIEGAEPEVWQKLELRINDIGKEVYSKALGTAEIFTWEIVENWKKRRITTLVKWRDELERLEEWGHERDPNLSAFEDELVIISEMGLSSSINHIGATLERFRDGYTEEQLYFFSSLLAEKREGALTWEADKERVKNIVSEEALIINIKYEDKWDKINLIKDFLSALGEGLDVDAVRDLNMLSNSYRKILSSIRPMGGEIQIASCVKKAFELNGTEEGYLKYKEENIDSTMRLEEAVVEVGKNFPSDWVSASNDKGNLFYLDLPDRASYGDLILTTLDESRTLSMPDWKVIQIPVEDPSLYQTLTHELSHRMSHSVEGLKMIEEAFYKRRTKNSLAENYAEDELVRPDHFIHRYAGRDYQEEDLRVEPELREKEVDPTMVSRRFEVLSVGIEAIMAGGYEGLIGANKYNSDRDMAHFVLGVLATL
jgi:hypothetical protein